MTDVSGALRAGPMLTRHTDIAEVAGGTRPVVGADLDGSASS